MVRANTFAQGVTILCAPVLARLYSPSDFGVFAVFTSILGIWSSIASWRFEWSIPNCSSRTQAAALVAMGTFCTALMGLTGWGILLTGTLDLGTQSLGKLKLLLPVALMAAAMQQLMQGWYVREGDLSSVSRARITQSVAGVAASVLAGLAAFGSSGLVGSSVVSTWLRIGSLIRKAPGLAQSLKRLSPVRVWATFRRFGWESSASAATSAVNTTSLLILPLVLSQFYSATEVGWYALMSRLSLAPARLFTSAVAQSFWSEASRLIRADRPVLERLFLRTSGRLLMLALPVAAVCLLGPLFVGVLFGEQWDRAGLILAALSPALLGQIAVSPVSHLVVQRKQHWQLAWDISRLVLIIFVMVGCAMLGKGIVQTTLSVSAVMFVMYVLLFFLNLACFRTDRGIAHG